MAWDESPNILKKGKIPHASKKFIWKKKKKKKKTEKETEKEGKKKRRKKKKKVYVA